MPVSLLVNIAPPSMDGKKRTDASLFTHSNCSLEVNALSTFLLAFLLLPLLRKTTSLSSVHPRIVILSSGVHTWTNLEEYRDADNTFQAMSDKEQFKGAGRYPLSKLLDTLLTCELGERLKSSKHPEDQKISLSG
jgi:NAD(P)-dependent dehydrogenase (short-subunit alcohol dehydrogenase family)